MAEHTPYILDEALGYWLNLTFNKLRARSIEVFQQAGYRITPEQWAVMTRLWIKDGVSQTELAQSTFKDKASVTRMIDALERQGYVKRAADEKDRRRYRVVLTARGRDLEGELVPTVRAFIASAYTGLSEAEQKAMVENLQQIYRNLDR